MTAQACLVDGCDRLGNERGRCHAHYEYRRRTGRDSTKPVLDTPEKRFWAKVNKDGPVPECRPDLGPCWLWTGAKAGNQRYEKYGRVQLAGTGKTSQAHVVSYQWAGGVVPEGWDVDHLCRVSLCVRPSHLEAVTHKENLRRGNGQPARNARKTHCIRGHAFTVENTYSGPRGGRTCRTCRRLRFNERSRQIGVLPRAEYLASLSRTHGTAGTYQSGCRCEPCRQAATEERRRYRLRADQRVAS